MSVISPLVTNIAITESVQPLIRSEHCDKVATHLSIIYALCLAFYVNRLLLVKEIQGNEFHYRGSRYFMLHKKTPTFLLYSFSIVNILPFIL